MRPGKQRVFVLISVVGLLLAGFVHAQSSAATSAPASAERNPTETGSLHKVPCTVGKETGLTLKEGELVRLECATTSDGVVECDVRFYRSGDVQVVENAFRCLETGASSRGGTDARAFKGSLRQTADLPYLAVTTWTLDGSTADLRFCIESDLPRIHQLFHQARVTEKGRWAMQFRNSLLVPVPELSETERLMGFVKLWSEVKYNFVFFSKRPELDWDKVLAEFLPKVKEAESTVEYYRLLTQCMALLRDGHTGVWGPLDQSAAYTPQVCVEPVGEHVVITYVPPLDAFSNPATREEMSRANLKRGDEIVSVNGRSVQEILQKDLYPYICASTTQSLDLEAVPRVMNGKNRSQAVLTVRTPSGAVREVSLTRRTIAPFRKPRVRSGTTSKEYPGGILWIDLPSFSSDDDVKPFRDLLPQIAKARGLVLDVRSNSGGSTDVGSAIIAYLIDKPIKGSHWKTRQYMPAYRAWGKPEKWQEGDHSAIEPKGGNPFLGPVVVLTGPNTFSAAEDFVVALHASRRARIVGERTGGSTGQPLTMELQGDGGARICTKWDSYPDGRDFVGVGVLPDVEVHPTPQDVADDRDRVLEAGIEAVRKELAADPNSCP